MIKVLANYLVCHNRILAAKVEISHTVVVSFATRLSTQFSALISVPCSCSVQLDGRFHSKVEVLVKWPNKDIQIAATDVYFISAQMVIGIFARLFCV